MNKSGQYLNFDDEKVATPTKRPKIVDPIYDDGYEMEENQLEFGDYKDNN
jgi:hypothetical protein